MAEATHLITSDVLELLATALAIGLLIGMERGWHERQAAEGRRVAGLRTFGLTGLLGGLSALMAGEYGALVLGLAFVGYAILTAVAYWIGTRSDDSFGITTEMAGFVTFLLGAAAVGGYQTEAVAAAVLVTLLLGLKSFLHSMLERLNQQELFGILQMLLISVVLLPVLPNKGYGPWQALNPYVIWWMIVLVAGIGFLGYFAIRIFGNRKGLMLTSLFGGLSSSTALTVAFSRIGHQQRSAVPLLAVGIIVASATMFPRVLVEVAVVNRALLPLLALPLGVMALTAFVGAYLFWRGVRGQALAETDQPAVRNPFELGSALRFGLLLVAIMFLAHALKVWFGHAGIYALATFSGLADVDALVISLSNLAANGLDPTVAAQGIVIATVVNTLVKTGLAFVLGGLLLGRRVGMVVLPSLVLGLLALFLI